MKEIAKKLDVNVENFVVGEKSVAEIDEDLRKELGRSKSKAKVLITEVLRSITGHISNKKCRG